MSRPVTHVDLTRPLVVDLAPHFPQDGSWAVLSATITRWGNVVTLAIGARPVTASGTVDLLTVPARYLPPTPVIGELMGVSVRAGRIFLNQSSGGLTSYATTPSSTWCYLTLTWITTRPL